MQELIYPPFPAPVMPLPTAEMPSDQISVSAEMVPIVEPSGEVVGQAARQYVHGGSKLLHPVVHLHILNRFGDLYLQKRSMSKDLLPGYWDTAVGGHVDYGESIAEALFREVSEELRIYDFNPIAVTSYVWESDREKELVNVFACIGDFKPDPDGDEVEEGRYWSFKEIEESLGKSVLTPNFEGEFARIRKDLEALL